MTLLPIVQRELRVVARRGGLYWVRALMALAAIVVTACIFVFTLGMPPSQVGRHIFQALAGLLFVYCLVHGRRSTADCLSQEKRDGTLGLLFLTDLKGHDVVLGKLAATSLRGFYGLLAVFPVLAVPLLLGGITNAEFWRMVMVLVDTFLLSLAIGMLSSAVSREVRRAMAANFLLLLLILAAPPATAAAIAYFHPAHVFVRELLFSCPVYAFYLCFEGQYAFFPMHFWWSILLMLALSLLLILLASLIVPRAWQDQPNRSRRTGWRDLWHRWSYGKPDGQRQFRRAALDRNAFFWLAARARLKPVHVWTFLAFMIAWWLAGWATSGQTWLDPSVAVLTALLLNCTFKIWLAIEAGQQMAEDQKAGAFELLLSSSLTVKDLLQGQLLALRRQFLRPLLVVIAVQLVFMWALQQRGLPPFPLTWIAAILVLLADLCALAWVGMRRALSAKSHNHATISTTMRVLFLPWLLFGLALGFLNLWFFLLDREWSPGWNFYLGIWFGFSLLVDAVLGVFAWKQLNTRFRQLALRGFHASDKPAGTERTPAVATPAPARASVSGSLPNATAPASPERGIEKVPDHPQTVLSPQTPVLTAPLVPSRRLSLRARTAFLVVLLVILAVVGFILARPRYPLASAVTVVLTRTNVPLQIVADNTFGAALILLPDGSLWRWGNRGGRGTSPSPWPARLGTNQDWVQVDHSVGLRSDNSIWHWQNQAAINDPVALSAPHSSSEPTWLAVTASVTNSIGLGQDGTLWSWPLFPSRNAALEQVRIGTNDDWVAVCSQWQCTLGIRRDGTLWVWGQSPYFIGGQGPVAYLSEPTQLCRETNWVGFEKSFFPMVRNRAGEVWQPFYGLPAAGASASSNCRLLFSNALPGCITMAICDQPKLFQVRPDGTLWQQPFRFGTAAISTAPWERVGKRSDWVSLHSAAGAAFGLTADGMLWTWGFDLSRTTSPALSSRFRALQMKIRSLFGSGPGTATMVGGMPPVQKQPRPLLRLLPPPDNTGPRFSEQK